MKVELTYGDKCIVARNENEIKDLQQLRQRILNDTNQAIAELRKQNREILGRK